MHGSRRSEPAGQGRRRDDRGGRAGHVSEADRAQCARAPRSGRRSGTRISASGNPGPGPRCTTPCAPTRSGLAALGARARRQVAIVGYNRPQLYWTMAAASRSAPFRFRSMPTRVADEMAYVLAHAEVTHAAVEDQEQVDKILSVADQAAAADRHALRRAARPARLRPRRAAPHRRRASTMAASALADDAGAPRMLEARDRRGEGRRPRHHPLHVGHDRPAEGRDAVLSTTSIAAAPHTATTSTSSTERTRSSPICRSPGSATTSSPTRRPRRGLLRQLPGEPGDRGRRPARDRRRPMLRAAARLRELLTADDGADGGCERAQAADVPLISSTIARRWGEKILNGEPGAGCATACSTGSATCWSTAR